MNKSFRRRRSQRGSSLVEGALCLTLFLMMVFGIMDFGRAVMAYNTISFAAREGARYAMVHGSSSGHPASSSDVRNYVLGYSLGIPSSDLTVNTKWNGNTTTGGPGSTVAVAVTYSFTPLGPYMPAGPWSLRSTSKMVVSQ